MQQKMFALNISAFVFFFILLSRQARLLSTKSIQDPIKNLPQALAIFEEGEKGENETEAEGKRRKKEKINPEHNIFMSYWTWFFLTFCPLLIIVFLIFLNRNFKKMNFLSDENDDEEEEEEDEEDGPIDDEEKTKKKTKKRQDSQEEGKRKSDRKKKTENSSNRKEEDDKNKKKEGKDKKEQN